MLTYNGNDYYDFHLPDGGAISLSIETINELLDDVFKEMERNPRDCGFIIPTIKQNYENEADTLDID